MTVAPGFGINIPAPRDATRVGDWLPTTDGSDWLRLFDGARREAAGVCVDVFGGQRLDGTVKERRVRVSPLEGPTENMDFDAAAAREYAYSLHNIAEIEAITDPDEAAQGFALAKTFEAAADEIDFWAAIDGSAG